MKYYYDCPIEAAYMAKNFGMAFNGRSKVAPIEYRGCDDSAEIVKLQDITIHPVSIKLLEPQQFDILDIQYKDGSSDLIYFDGENMPESEHTSWIIQRNNKPFIMPKMGNANVG